MHNNELFAHFGTASNVQPDQEKLKKLE